MLRILESCEDNDGIITGTGGGMVKIRFNLQYVFRFNGGLCDLQTHADYPSSI